jgi:hypothetical protein
LTESRVIDGNRDGNVRSQTPRWHSLDSQTLLLTGLSWLSATPDPKSENQRARGSAGSAGYAIDEEENETGLTCVAAAIHSADGRPAAAISVSGLSDRMHLLELAQLGKRVQAHCARSGVDIVFGHSNISETNEITGAK